MNRQGRLTKERFGLQISARSPLYRVMPVTIKDFEMIIVLYETDEERALDILPEELEVTSPIRAGVSFGKYRLSTIGPYNEAVQFITCLWDGKPMEYVANMCVDSDAPLAHGREIFGFPKKIASVELIQKGEVLEGRLERPKDMLLCTAKMSPQVLLDPTTFSFRPMVNLKIIPHVEGQKVSVAELIEARFNSKMSYVWGGPGSIELNEQSVLDDWHILPVKKVIRAFYVRGEIEGPWGKELKKY